MQVDVSIHACKAHQGQFVVKVVVTGDDGEHLATARYSAQTRAEADSIKDSILLAAEIGSDVLMAVVGDPG